eukprot:scaffold18609_cov91-Phaeocystis_antarctica.AAC.1
MKIPDLHTLRAVHTFLQARHASYGPPSPRMLVQAARVASAKLSSAQLTSSHNPVSGARRTRPLSAARRRPPRCLRGRGHVGDWRSAPRGTRARGSLGESEDLFKEDHISSTESCGRSKLCSANLEAQIGPKATWIGNGTGEIARKLYKSRPGHDLAEIVRQRYADDAKLLGYAWPGHVDPLPGRETAVT